MAAAGLLALLSSPGCEERVPGEWTPKPRADASARSSVTDGGAAEPRPTGEGCARAGALEGVETDATCVLERAGDDVMREAAKRLTLALQADPPETTGGGTSLLRLTITNVATSDTLVVLDALPASALSRPDWSRIAGVPEVHGNAPTGLRAPLVVSTVDARGRSVDATPMIGGSQGQPRLMGVRLRPGAKLTHQVQWWALRIPSPAPIHKNDAGHVIVPKTAPVPLEKGDYVVRVEVPFHGLPSAERTVSTSIHVADAPKQKKH